MITMEFDDIKKIWDSQDHRPLYAIDERALHKRIVAKKNRSRHIANKSEIILMVTNLLAPTLILIIDKIKDNGNYFSYILATLMVATAGFILYSRMQRKRTENQFNRSMLGDLDHAIAHAIYQVRLSYIMRWYMAPVVLLCFLSVWDKEISISLILFMVVFFTAAFFAGTWEHRWYTRRKQSLEALREKLVHEEMI